MTRKLRAVIPAILCVALAASACSKKEETPTFTGDKTEEPSYQANLDFVTPIYRGLIWSRVLIYRSSERMRARLIGKK